MNMLTFPLWLLTIVTPTYCTVGTARAGATVKVQFTLNYSFCQSLICFHSTNKHQICHNLAFFLVWSSCRVDACFFTSYALVWAPHINPTSKSKQVSLRGGAVIQTHSWCSIPFFFLSAIVCPWLNFGLPPHCPRVVWCH